MLRDYTAPLWLLKLGAPLNAWFFAETFGPGAGGGDPHILMPARIFFAVSAWRCLFPNRYEGNVVLHDTPLSSALVTRVLATFSEVAYIYQFSHVIRVLNVEQVGWIDGLSWLMVLAVSISQLFVWSAITTGRLGLYVHEETGWAILFAANTLASAWLYATVGDLEGRETLLILSVLFGAGYLPWQGLHLRALSRNARASGGRPEADSTAPILSRLGEAFHARRRATDAESWGGAIGLTWMVAYWATLIPLWVHVVVQRIAAN